MPEHPLILKALCAGLVGCLLLAIGPLVFPYPDIPGYPPLAAVLRSGDDPSSVSTGANTVICTSARDGRCDERS